MNTIEKSTDTAATLYARACIASVLMQERNSVIEVLEHFKQFPPDQEDLEGIYEMHTYEERVRIYDRFLSEIETA